MQVNVVQVDLLTQNVLAMLPMDSAAVPAAPDGSYYLVPGVDFPAAATVALGYLWDGTRDVVNTRFLASVKAIATIDTAKAARELAIDQLVKANTDYDAAVAAAS